MKWQGYVVSRWTTRGALAALGALALGCSGAEDDSSNTERVRGVEQAVANGTAMTSAQVQSTGLVAIYHREAGVWWPRPCSGIVIRYNGVSTVLTARHCITTDSSIGGALSPMSDLRLIASASPGPANPNPPAGAIQPSSSIGMPATAADVRTRDMAVLTVNANWSANVASRWGLFVRNPSTLATNDETLIAYGYGINVDDPTCFSTNVSTGAGVARFGSPFSVVTGSLSSPGGRYGFVNPNGSSQKIVCGDSGGPDIGWLGDDDYTWGHVLGVHGGPEAGNMVNTATNKWLQDTLRGVYLSSYRERNMNVGWNTATTLRMWPKDDEDVLAIKYDLALQRIIVVQNGKCLSSSMLLETCGSTSAHKWVVSSGQTISSVAQPTKCLTHTTSNGLALQTCSSVADTRQRQMWAFHAQL